MAAQIQRRFQTRHGVKINCHARDLLMKRRGDVPHVGRKWLMPDPRMHDVLQDSSD